jgi:hypothetical protein
MSTTTTGSPAPVDERSTAQMPPEAGTDPVPSGDGLPFECAEFGVEGFLPHLDAASER